MTRKFDDPNWVPLLEEFNYRYMDYQCYPYRLPDPDRPLIPEPKKGAEPFIIHYSSHRFHIVIKFRRVVDTLYALNPKDTPELVRRKLHEIMIYEAFNT